MDKPDFDEDAKAELRLQLPVPGKRGEHQVDFAFPVAPTTGLLPDLGPIFSQALEWRVRGGCSHNVPMFSLH